MNDNDLEPPARLPWSERPGASVIVAGGTLGGTALGSLTAAVWIGASFARAESGGFDATYSIMGTLFAAGVGGYGSRRLDEATLLTRRTHSVDHRTHRQFGIEARG